LSIFNIFKANQVGDKGDGNAIVDPRQIFKKCFFSLVLKDWIESSTRQPSRNALEAFNEQTRAEII